MINKQSISELDEKLVENLSYSYAKRHNIISVSLENNQLLCFVNSNTKLNVMLELQRISGYMVKPLEISTANFITLLNQAYEKNSDQASYNTDDIENNLDLDVLANNIPAIEDLMDSEDEAPIIKLLNNLLTQAVRQGVSDLHVEPFENKSVIRFRIDGTLRTVMEPQQLLHAILVSRIKVMAKLDIAEKRIPQDGRITLRLAGRAVDVRVSTMPAAHGERVVMRLLDKQASRLTIDALGMSKKMQVKFEKLINQPHGILLVTGPTGSGKTTSLYGALEKLDSKTLNIMTVEDPIEYNLDGIGQTQINSKIDMSFARALRAILRQDPDIVMIGEIRDLETAQIAVQASLTGHLVLATLHTNDSVSTITRLIDMGVEPFLVASSLLGALGQRLVHKLCPECKQEVPQGIKDYDWLIENDEQTKIYCAGSCDACSNTGYQGRTGIYELFTVDDNIKTLIHDRASEAGLRKYAVSNGMTTILDDSIRWIKNGTTSPEEVLRVVREANDASL